MKNLVLFFLFTALLQSCASSKPVYWKMNNDGKYTGLDTIVNINGYYLSNGNCDDQYIKAFIFYENGIFINCNIKKEEDFKDDVERRFQKSADISLISWGIYIVSDDFIYGQGVTVRGGIYSPIANDYTFSIKTNNEIELEYNYTHINGILKQKPNPPCKTLMKFYPLENIINYEKCPYINKKWFINRKQKK